MSEAQNGGKKMERLTIPDVRVDEHTTRRTIIDARVVREHAMDFYWRLKAYEDTGLESEEVSTLVTDWSDLCTIVGECGGLSRVRVLAEADKDGRLVVRPYSIGETVYVLLKDGAIFYPETNGWYISEEIIEAISHDGFYLGDPVDNVYTPDSEIGKTVFLTREEADRALEAMKDGN